MSRDGLEAQICITCEKEFLSEVVEPIPVCPDCRLEEQVTALTLEDEGEKTQTRRVAIGNVDGKPKSKQKKEAKKKTAAAETKKPVAPPPAKVAQKSAANGEATREWYVRKLDGQSYGPFSTDKVRRWAEEGKILASEEVCIKDGGTMRLWVPIRQQSAFANLFPQTKPETSSRISKESGPILDPLPSSNKEQAFPDNLPLNLGPPELPWTLEPPSAKDRWRFNLPGETSALFGSGRKGPRLDLKKAAYLGGALACAALLVFLIFKIDWSKSAHGVSQWWRSRNRVPDQVDAYIAQFKTELPPLAGQAAAPIDLEKQARALLENETWNGLHSAQIIFERALVQNPDFVPAMAGLAETLSELAFHSEDTKQSLMAYDFAFKAVKLEPNSSVANRAFAHFHIRQGNKKEALPYLQKAKSQSAQDARLIALEGEWNLLHVAEKIPGRINLEKISAETEPPANDAEAYLETAIQNLRQALTLNPALGSARYFLAQGLLGQYQYAHAERELMKISSGSSPGVALQTEQRGALSIYAARAEMELGRLHFLLGPSHYPLAKSHYEQALILDGNLVEARLLLTELLLHYWPGKRDDNAKQALPLLDAALKNTLRQNDRRDLMMQTAAAWRAQRRLPEAIQVMKQAVKAEETDRQAQFSLGLLYLYSGDRQQAFEILNPLAEYWRQRPTLFPFYYAQTMEGDPAAAERALRFYRELIDKYPDFPQGHIGLARLLMSLSETKEAEHVLWQAGLRDISYLNTHHWRQRLLPIDEPDVTQLLKVQGDYLRQNSFSVEGMTAYAYLAVMNGQRDTALKLLEGALNQDPQDQPANHLYAQILLGEGKYARVIELMRSQLRNESRTPIVLLGLAEAYTGVGNYALANQHLQTLIEDGKFLPRVYAALGNVYAGAKKGNEARTAWIKALDLDPTFIPPKLALYNAGF